MSDHATTAMGTSSLPSASALSTITDPTRRSLYERSLVADAALDADALAELWHEEGSVRIASNRPAVGRDAVRGFFSHFFSLGLFDKLEHEMHEVWNLEDALIYRADALYTRGDGMIALPYVNVVKYRDGLLDDYRVFIDTKPLFG